MPHTSRVHDTKWASIRRVIWHTIQCVAGICVIPAVVLIIIIMIYIPSLVGKTKQPPSARALEETRHNLSERLLNKYIESIEDEDENVTDATIIGEKQATVILTSHFDYLLQTTDINYSWRNVNVASSLLPLNAVRIGGNQEYSGFRYNSTRPRHINFPSPVYYYGRTPGFSEGSLLAGAIQNSDRYLMVFDGVHVRRFKTYQVLVVHGNDYPNEKWAHGYGGMSEFDSNAVLTGFSDIAQAAYIGRTFYRRTWTFCMATNLGCMIVGKNGTTKNASFFEYLLATNEVNYFWINQSAVQNETMYPLMEPVLVGFAKTSVGRTFNSKGYLYLGIIQQSENNTILIAANASNSTGEFTTFEILYKAPKNKRDVTKHHASYSVSVRPKTNKSHIKF